MAIGKQHIFDAGIYFLTFTNYKWLHLFEHTQSYDLVYKWFESLKANGNEILGYVVIPNHVHALIGYKQTNKSLNTIIGNGKRFIAYGIVERLKAAQHGKLLQLLSGGVSSSDRKRGKIHEVFEPSFDLEQCYSYKFCKAKA